MKIRPIHSNVIIKSYKVSNTTESKIIRPDTVEKDAPEKGKVIAVGDGNVLKNGSRAPMSVKEGDVVMFKKYSPDEIKLDGEDFLIVADEDIIAVIE